MDNPCIMQFFEWNLPNDGQLWNRLAAEAPHLAKIGVTAVWIPPACKCAQQNSVGYDPYDLYDLGEFDQKGTVRTKYGVKAELLAAVGALHKNGVKVYADVVLNHKGGADGTETFPAVEVDPNDRLHELSPPHEIEGWTKFDFPGRGGKYSGFRWDHTHFTATDRDEKTGKNAIFKVYGEGKVWAEHVDSEKNNFDYLMLADIDYHNGCVADEIKRWALWFVNELGLDGFRLDALKHIDQGFVKDLIGHVRRNTRQDFFVVGEYWRPEERKLIEFIDRSDQSLQLFDVSLHFRLHQASHAGRDYDLRGIFNDTLLAHNPFRAVTFVDNHDSQPGQALESWVLDWFKPLAYALILLRRDGIPCVFYGDYYGVAGGYPGMKDMLDILLKARKTRAYGEQNDYFDHGNVVGWVRGGDEAHKNSGLAALLSSGDAGTKKMSFGRAWAGRELIDLTGGQKETVRLNDEGTGTFTVGGGSVAVWALPE